MSAADPPPAIRTLQAMDPKDVPMALVDAAWPVCEREGIPWHDDAVRMILAAVIPAIEGPAQARGASEALAKVQAELVKLRAACHYQDALAAQYRIGLSDALGAIDRIARGDQ